MRCCAVDVHDDAIAARRRYGRSVRAARLAADRRGSAPVSLPYAILACVTTTAGRCSRSCTARGLTFTTLLRPRFARSCFTISAHFGLRIRVVRPRGRTANPCRGKIWRQFPAFDARVEPVVVHEERRLDDGWPKSACRRSPIVRARRGGGRTSGAPVTAIRRVGRDHRYVTCK